MSSSWDQVLPPDRIDPLAFLYTGADPCWTPEREFKLPDSPDADPKDCILCHGAGLTVMDGDERVELRPLIEEGSHRVCARCMRHGRSLRDRNVSTGDPDPNPDVPVESDPGYVSRNGVTVPERFARLMKG